MGDRQRELAKQHGEAQHGLATAALRAAMWLAVVKGHTHDVAAHLAAQLQSYKLSRTEAVALVVPPPIVPGRFVAVVGKAEPCRWCAVVFFFQRHPTHPKFVPIPANQH